MRTALTTAIALILGVMLGAAFQRWSQGQAGVEHLSASWREWEPVEPV